MSRHLHSRTVCALTLVLAAVAAALVSLSLYSAPTATPAPILETPAASDTALLTWAYMPTHPWSEIEPTRIVAQDYGGARCLRPKQTVRGGWSRPTPPTWTRADRARTRALVDLVAREMGVNRATRRLVVRWAVRESVGAKPWQIHIYPEDVRAATSPGARERIAAMGREWGADWSYGRGLYGMQPSLYIQRWDASASLDVLCDPIVATVIAVWAARDHAAGCERRGHAPTLLVSNRRWGTGHCSPRAKDAKTRAWWSARGRDIDAPAHWGRKWRDDETERAAIYAHMREAAHAKGLIEGT